MVGRCISYWTSLSLGDIRSFSGVFFLQHVHQEWKNTLSKRTPEQLAIELLDTQGWGSVLTGSCWRFLRTFPWNISLRIQSPSQMMIRVYNHLLSKVFRFHYPSQKVIVYSNIPKTPNQSFLKEFLLSLGMILIHDLVEECSGIVVEAF